MSVAQIDNQRSAISFFFCEKLVIQGRIQPYHNQMEKYIYTRCDLYVLIFASVPATRPYPLVLQISTFEDLTTLRCNVFTELTH